MQSADRKPLEGELRRELDARFRAPLTRFFYRRTGDRAAAEDLTQETFVRLLGSGTFAQVEEANAFVFRVASNLLRDRSRRAAYRSEATMASFDPNLTRDLAEGLIEDLSPERVLIGRESLNQALACLEELGARTKHIFILFRLEGMKQKEIAALYGMGLSTVEKHVIRATLHLAKWSRGDGFL